MSSKPQKKGKKRSNKKQKPTSIRKIPTARLERSLLIESPHNYPTFAFSYKKLPSKTPFISTDPSRQVYPKNLKPIETDIIFSGKFESGNLDAVYTRGPNAYEIHISPDPKHTAQWFYFKAGNVHPGRYTFVITGFHRDTGIHHHGVYPVAYSINDSKKGIGWKRIGENMNYWLSISGHPREYTMSFEFTVTKKDTMYFAYTYPYNYSDLTNFLHSLPKSVAISYSLKSQGSLKVPMIFWDSDTRSFLEISNKANEIQPGSNPFIVICARHHPGETCSSFAMEGFMRKLFDESNPSSVALMRKFSFLFIPMINVDGVVCGFYRPGLDGIDYNRVWKKKSSTKQTSTIISIIDKIAASRKLVFFLDFHGHAGLFNSFTYTIKNRKYPLTDLAPIFPRLMSKHCPFFSTNLSHTLGPKAYERTMRVALHHRYGIPFSYTLEMSIGGSSLVRPTLQFTPKEYREIGQQTLMAMHEMLLVNKEISGHLFQQPKHLPKLNRDVSSVASFKLNRVKSPIKSGRSPMRRHYSADNSEAEESEIE